MWSTHRGNGQISCVAFLHTFGMKIEWLDKLKIMTKNSTSKESEPEKVLEFEGGFFSGM
jgi:hypothetical protein